MEVNFSAGEAGTVWIHGIPVARVDECVDVTTYDRDGDGKRKFKIGYMIIRNVTIRLVSEDFE